MTLVNVNNVWFRYGIEWVLEDVSFSVGEGEFFGIIGPNGSGKTTLLRIIDGILKPNEGSVAIDGAGTAGMKRSDLARVIAVVPQETQYVFPFTAGEIVMMGRSPHLGLLSFEGAKDFGIVEKAMRATDTLPLADRNFDELSGGERQRVIIARALAQEPKVILLDEPTAHLDLRHQIALTALMRSLCRERNVTAIAVTHDINLASLFCDRLMFLDDGKVRALGPPREVVTETVLREVYGVPVQVDVDIATGLPRVMPTARGLEVPH
ncbi:MAG: ABC transporter ATP-binding protein [Syntrophales bacterium LBB04]|nr:ABC transporter ATP-binding protein [Syntrophales bacterium LBB04]